ncbi:MAG TPA: hypothetical protein PK095_13440 [Myxococcota bacterium]|nr:hypothetical protein [Myxococcota bacterium]
MLLEPGPRPRARGGRLSASAHRHRLERAPAQWHDTDQAAYPVLTWDVPLTGTSCAANPLDGNNSGVRTDYLRNTSKTFAYQLSCEGDPDITTLGNLCIIEGSEDIVRFTEAQGLVVVEHSGVTPFSAPLPPGLKLAGETGPTGCCADPCCGP